MYKSKIGCVYIYIHSLFCIFVFELFLNIFHCCPTLTSLKMLPLEYTLKQEEDQWLSSLRRTNV